MNKHTRVEISEDMHLGDNSGDRCSRKYCHRPKALMASPYPAALIRGPKTQKTRLLGKPLCVDHAVETALSGKRWECSLNPEDQRRIDKLDEAIHAARERDHPPV